jgi:hypothetical protein
MGCNCGKKNLATQPAKKIIKTPSHTVVTNGTPSTTRRFIRRVSK